MGAAPHLAGEQVTGTRRMHGATQPRIWNIKERLNPKNETTPGQFSIGYKVVDSDGREAFMKVSDLDLLTGQEGDLLERIGAAARAHKFERTILDYCQGNNMDRVVTAIDYGTCKVEINGTTDILFFLIFEMAEGDIRNQITISRRAEFLWCMNALHHLAVAIQQLHGGGVCHNDIKPANFLLINQEIQKLADLGCATSAGHAGVHELRHDVGDPTYAAPEIIYADTTEWKSDLCRMESRRASDLYQLGSIAWFMVTGRMVTPTIVGRMDTALRPPRGADGWTGSAEQIFPYWREAQSRALIEDFQPALDDVAASIAPDIRSSFTSAVLQLVECDPSLRGHPLNRVGSQDRLSVERYVALFDRMRRGSLAAA